MSDLPATTTRTQRIASTVEIMKSRGQGGSCTTKEMAEWSGYKVDTQNLSYFVSDVRAELTFNGLYLSGEGQDGEGFFIVRASENAVVAARFANKATKSFRMMETLLVNTDRSTMTAAEQRRHEKELRELRYTNRMIERKSDVLEVVKKHRPGLLKDDVAAE